MLASTDLFVPQHLRKIICDLWLQRQRYEGNVDVVVSTALDNFERWSAYYSLLEPFWDAPTTLLQPDPLARSTIEEALHILHT